MKNKPIKLSEITELIGNPITEIETSISKFDNYDVIKAINDELFIVATEKPISGMLNRDVAINIKGNFYHVLIDLIDMYSHLSFSNKIISRRTEIDKLILDSDIQIILKFCKKNGLPYWGDKYSKEYRNEAIMYNEVLDYSTIFNYTESLKQKYNSPKLYVCYCNLSYFLYYASILYSDFIRYLAIYNPDMLERIKIINTNIGSFKINDCIRENYYPRITDLFTFETRLSKIKNNFYFEVGTNNIFSASVYYFSLVCTSKYINIEKSIKIKKCVCCGGSFITSQGNKKYCEFCSPQKAWNNKNRKSKEIS